MQNITQDDEIERRWRLPDDIIDGLLQKRDAGSISLVKPADFWGDIYCGGRGVSISLDKPFRHRAFTATDFQDSTWVRNPELQTADKIVQINKSSTINLCDCSFIRPGQRLINGPGGIIL